MIVPLMALVGWQIRALMSKGSTERDSAPVSEASVDNGAQASEAGPPVSEPIERAGEREQTVEVLLEMLDTRDSEAYFAALRLLQERDPERATEVLIQRLAEAEPQDAEEAAEVSRRRALAVRGLGIVGDERAVDPLLRLLVGADRDLRLEAAESLQQIRLRRESPEAAEVAASRR